MYAVLRGLQPTHAEPRTWFNLFDPRHPRAPDASLPLLILIAPMVAHTNDSMNAVANPSLAAAVRRRAPSPPDHVLYLRLYRF